MADTTVFTRKYGTLLVTGTTAIRIPIRKAGSTDLAASGDWTPAAGDVKVFVNGTAAANITNLPTAVAGGANGGAMWEFILTAAELTCRQLEVLIVDAATKAIADTVFNVETYGNSSGMLTPDYSGTYLPANVLQINSSTTPAATLGNWLTAWPSATAQGGSATTITLTSGASAVDGFYNGWTVVLWSGTGINQYRLITGYVGSTKVATVNIAWSTNPVSGTGYVLVPAGMVDVEAISLDATAADNAESFFDGTGYAGTNNVIPTVTTLTNYTAPDNTTITAISNRLGAFTGTGVNTVLGMFKAMLSKSATKPSDVGGTFDPATDSSEAVRDVLGSVVTSGSLMQMTAQAQTYAQAAATRIGAFTGDSNENSALGFLMALMDKDAPKPTDMDAYMSNYPIGVSSYNPATDSNEAIRDRGDAAWASTAPTATVIADTVWRRHLANILASTDGDSIDFRSPLGAMAKLVNKVVVSGGTLTVYQPDDTTALGTQAVTTDADADPITGVDTN